LHEYGYYDVFCREFVWNVDGVSFTEAVYMMQTSFNSSL